MAKQKNPWMKYILILVVALILLLISILKNRRYQQKTELVFDLNKKDINGITIMSNKDTVSFSQLNDSTWTPVEPDTGDINENKVNQLISGLLELEQTGIATEKPDNHETYNVGENATFVQLKKGENVLKSFYLGRSTSSWSQGYLRFKDENKVYRTNQNLSHVASPDPNSWQQ
ncbi:MAG: DUF4340 domain-containing protein [Candidatus Marinimicrobia bacterium]|nr:DUF4340 domain-containing protein [Candidatus Neomarinimicrobiota bacterium]